MTMQFAFGDAGFEAPRGQRHVDRLREHAAEVMGDVDGATPATIETLPNELPVEAAVACGKCLLYGGVNPPVKFPPWLAAVAASRLVPLVDDAATDADRLPRLWHGLRGEAAEDLVAGLLHVRMDAWAAALLFDEITDHVTDPADLLEATAALDAAIHRFDKSLYAQNDYLATLTDTKLLTNWRAMLAPAYRDPLPWWLDGSLESKAAEVDAAIDTLLPNMLFENRGAIVPLPQTTVATLRRAFVQEYAAAAATAAVSQSPRTRWRSPDGALEADLVLPLNPQAAPDRIVLDFVSPAGTPAVTVVGRRCTLAGVAAVVERRRIDGEDRAMAEFPGAAFFGPNAAVAETALTLVVEPDATAWKCV